MEQLLKAKETAATEKTPEQAIHQPGSAAATAQRSPTFADPGVNRMLNLQRTVGNSAVCRMIQAKLEVSKPGDIYEQEADQVAQRIMSVPVAQNRTFRASDQESENGILPGAEEAVSAASSSAGQPLPSDLRRKFQDALGADLSGVRTHTGSESVKANKAISARAYTLGSDIHFNERQYSPETFEGQKLLAHEVAHVVQQTGNGIHRKGAFSDEMVQRDKGDFSFPGSFPTVPDKSLPKDMVEMDWTPMAAPAQGATQPKEIAISLGPTPKAPPAEPSHHLGPGECKGLNCHEPTGPSQFQKTEELFIEMERNEVWRRLTADVAKTVDSFNRTAPLIRKYNQASQDPDLADVYGVSVAGPGDLGSKVEGEVVGGLQNKSGTTVAGVFGTGTSVDTKDINSNIDKAAKGGVNSTLRSALNKSKAVDYLLKAASDKVEATNHAAKSAAEEAETALLLIEEEKAGEEKKKAETELAEAKEKAEKVKKYIGWAIKGITFIAGLALAPEVAGPAAAAGAAAEGGKEEKGGLPEGAGEKAAMVAEKVVDFWYAGDLAKAGARVAKASEELKAAHNAYLNENRMAKLDALASKLTEVNQVMNELKAMIVERRGAYRDVATAAAIAVGGTPQQRQKVEASINAIPACETVVTATSNIIDSIEEVPYSRASGVAFGMALNSGSNATAGAAIDFTDSLGYLKGYKVDFKAKNRLWTARLNSARQILTHLGKGTA